MPCVTTAARSVYVCMQFWTNKVGAVPQDAACVLHAISQCVGGLIVFNSRLNMSDCSPFALKGASRLASS